MGNHYRADIDGLRAIAVVLVLIFHAFPDILPGGYLGVDVFFVISGYLVTKILIEESSTGRISIRNFYARRVRRIFPALITVFMAVLFAGWFLLRASEFSQLSKHVLGGATFSSNIMLWKESGYFDNISDTKPLLHLWSLGVEEQFYLGLPVLMFLTTKVASLRARSLLIAAPALASFCYCIYVSGVDATTAFYSPLSRVWELLAGSLLASISSQSKTKLPKFFSRSPYLGINLIFAGVFFVDLGEVSSGYWALLPVVGAVLLISDSSNNLVKNVLSSKMFVGLGLISYPLYLWHWPVLSFLRILEGRTPPVGLRALALVLSFVLAIVTYRCIEIPLKRHAKKRALLPFLVFGMAICIACSALVYANDGIRSRPIEHQAVKYDGDIGHEAFHNYIANNFYPCTPAWVYKSALIWDGAVRCNQSKKDTPIDTILLGDSHAEHLFIGLAESLPNHNVGFYIRGVPPIRDNSEFQPLYDEVLRNSNIRYVIVSARWSLRGVPVQETKSMILELQRAGKTVFITDDSPRFSFDPSLCKFRGECQEDRAVFDSAAESYKDDLFAVVKSNPELRFIRTSTYLCDQKFCSMNDSRNILFRDFDHLSIEGSRFIGQRVVDDWPELKN